MENDPKPDWKSRFAEDLKWHAKDFVLQACFVIGSAALGAALGGAICAAFGFPVVFGAIGGAIVFEMLGFNIWILRRRRRRRR